MSAIRVLVVDDYEPWRRYLAVTLRKKTGLHVIGEASDGLEAVQQAQELQPDLILLDIGLPTRSGIEAARRIREVSPASKILFVSENRSACIAKEALSTGAGGYVVKSDAAGELLPAVDTVLKGKRFLSANLTGHDSSVDDQTEAAGGGSMNAGSKDKTLDGDDSRHATAEQRLRQLGITLPAPPEPFGIYAEVVQTGNLLFLTGMLPTEGREAKFIGRVGAELDVEAGHAAARLAALNGLAVAKQYLGSLDQVTRIVRLGVAVATSGDVRDQPKVADGASELLRDVFGKDKNPSRLVYGVASLPLGTPVELELIFEVSA
jgi:DNA-binding NarL/FixJ family response regulator/enamine deaminase RidA (YjgF/YER057c/UK114 family)